MGLQNPMGNRIIIDAFRVYCMVLQDLTDEIH